MDANHQKIIEDIIAGPASVAGDAGTVVQQDPAKVLDVIERLERAGGGTTDPYKKKARGLRFTKLAPPGAV